MKENVERVIDSLLDESFDENAERFLQYLYEEKDRILEYREYMKKVSRKVRIK